MKYLLALIFINIICFGQNIDEIYKEALKKEKEHKYKEAMLLYKKALNLKNNPKDEYILDLSKNEKHEVKSFTKLKKDFYNEIIDKSDDEEANFTLKQKITGDFGLYPYHKNYLLPLTYDTKDKNDRENLETKFQFSIEKPISYNFFGLEESVSLAYTQKSFWQTTADSSPFRETNYLPEIFVQFSYKKSDTLKGYKISLLHESNGRNNEHSRSWNRVYLESYLQFSKLFVIPKIWYRIPEKSKDDDNPNITKFLGHGSLSFFYPYKKHTFDLELRNNFRLNSQNKGSAKLNWTFPLPEFVSSKNSYGFLQIFSGYGDSLIDYDKEIHKIGLGIAFSR